MTRTKSASVSELKTDHVGEEVVSWLGPGTSSQSCDQTGDSINMTGNIECDSNDSMAGDTETSPLINDETLSENNCDQKQTRDSNVCHRVKICCRAVTVEVVVVLYFVYYAGSIPLVQQLLYTKVAKSLNYTGPLPGDNSSDRESCMHPNTSDPNYILEQQVQADSASWLVYISGAYILSALFMTMFLGGYSDRAGRKIAMIIPLIGSLIRSGLFIAIVALELDLWLLVLGTVLDGISGGAAVIVMGCFSYMADISDPKSRSLRIIILEASISVGTVISNVGVGALIQRLGYLWPFVLLAGLSGVNLLYVLFRIQETVQRHEPSSFFTLDHVKSNFLVYLKDDETKRRTKLCLGLLFITLVSMVTFGKINITMLWLLKSPICWNAMMIGFYIAYTYVVYGIGGISATKLFQPRLGDLRLAVFACILSAASCLVFSFAHQDWLVWLAPFVGLLSGIPIGLFRSYMSKIVAPSEMGAMFGSVAIMELIGAMIGQMTFTAIYGVTLSPAWLSGLSFWIMALLLIIPVSISLLLQRLSRSTAQDLIQKVVEPVVD